MFKCISTALAIAFVAGCQSAPSPRQTGEDISATMPVAPHRTQQDTVVVAIAKQDTSATTWLLVPGISAGAVRVGETVERLYQQLGEADASDAAMQKGVSTWYSHHDTTSHSVGVYTSIETNNERTQLVRQIRVNSPSFHTREGIGPSAFLEAIRGSYQLQKTDAYRDGGRRYTVYTSAAGISFEVNEAGKCVAVVIHKAGLKDLGTYLQLRTTNVHVDKH